MDFIKKHYEKLLLAGALVVLIGSAAVLALRVSALSEDVNNFQQKPRPKVKTVQPSDTSLYTNAIASLKEPVLWQKRGNPFGAEFRPTGGGLPPPPPTPDGDPVAVAKIIRQPFKLIFTEYTGTGENFQINFITGRRSFFVRKVGDAVADRFGDTGYTTTKFDRKSTTQFNSTTGYSNTVDLSELTIQHPGDDPIVMPVNKVVEEKEPVAIAQCADGGQQLQIRRGQDFNCSTNTYNVVDINPEAVIIVNKLTKEKHTIKPASGR